MRDGGTRAQNRGQFLVTLLYYVAWALLIGGAVWVAVRWFTPFLLAFLTAALLQRPLRWLTARTGVSRGFLAGMLVVLLVAAVAAAVGGFGWWLWQRAVALFGDEERIRAFAARLTAAWETLAQWGEARLQQLPPAAEQALREALGGFSPADGLLGEWLLGAAGGVVRFAANSLPSLVFSFLVWMIASVFLTADYRRVTAALLQRLPPRAAAWGADLRTLCGGTVKQMARAYLCLMGVTFLELCAGLWLLRVKGAIPLAAVIALVDILPVLGVGTVLLPWAAVAALNGELRFAMWLAVLYLVITVVRNLLEPRLISRRVGLSPIVTLLCLYAGLRFGGFWGLLLLPFAVTVAIQLYQRRNKQSRVR